MQFEQVPVENLHLSFHDLWLNKWLLLTAGNFRKGEFNSMTVAWGSMGTMWNKPFVQIVVRPSRFTYGFTEKYDSFTLCTFSEKYRGALKYMGTRSGRNFDKVKQTGLTPIGSKSVDAPAYEEADLIFECSKIYYDDMRPENFLVSEIEKNYSGEDYHRIYFGEIKTILRKKSDFGVIYP